MNKHIKMIGMDLDGTLLTSNKELTEYTRNVLSRAIRQGVEVLVATGRPISAIPKELLEFPGMRYAVTANGARVIEVATGKILHENLLQTDIAEQVLDVFADYDDIYEVFIDGVGYTKADCMTHLEDYFPHPSMVQYMKKTRTPVEDVKATMLAHGKPVDKVHGIFRFEEERLEAEKRLLKIPGIEVSGALGNNLEANSAGANKGIAMVKLGEILGISREEIMACGDGTNDSEMLKAVGFGVAMANGDEAVKAVADYITDTNDNDGVAKAIERFVLV